MRITGSWQGLPGRCCVQDQVAARPQGGHDARQHLGEHTVAQPGQMHGIAALALRQAEGFPRSQRSGLLA
jgi:hypothetical protein